MDDSITSDDTKSRPLPGEATRKLYWLRVAALGGLAGLIAAVALVLAMRRGALPPLSAEALRDASARWESAAPRDYIIEIEVRGAQPAVYFVEVVAGEPIRAERNGTAISQRRSWETWTVPGMFNTLASDVDTQREHSNLVVRCQFDERYGYPARYERIEMGTGHQVSWEVRRFKTTAAR